MYAKHSGECWETGYHIAKGDKMYYRYANKKAYCTASTLYKHEHKKLKP